MKIIHLFMMSFLLLIACKPKQPLSLEDKKAALATLNSEQVTLTAKIKALELEIGKLEPIREAKVKNITVTPIVKSEFQHFVETSGRVEAENNIFVSPKSGGAITNVLVKVGDFVKKGQQVAMIDNTVIRSSMLEVEIQLETARTLFEKQKALWDQKIGTEVQFIQAKTQLESMEKRLATLKSQDGMNVVRSPIAGYVDEIRLKAGEIAAPGIGIMRIVNTNELKVTANVPDTYAGTIQKGARAKIKFPDLKKEVTAILTFVGQTINPVSRTFIIEAKLPSDKNLKPNLLAQIMINDLTHKSTISIDQNLIQNTEQGTIVYIAVSEGDKRIAKAVLVQTGLSFDGKIEIISGLNAGDMLITQGASELVDGDNVNF